MAERWGKLDLSAKPFSRAPLRRRRRCGGIKDGKAARAAIWYLLEGEGSRHQDTCVLLASLFRFQELLSLLRHCKGSRRIPLLPVPRPSSFKRCCC